MPITPPSRASIRARALPVAAAALALAFASCQKPKEEDVGTIRAKLVSESAGDDVVEIRVDVSRGGAAVASQTVRVRPDQPVPDAGATQAGADAFFNLRAGEYDVLATPLAAGGSPSQVCAKGTARTQVRPGRTTEIVMALFCGGQGTGGLDVVVVLEHQPTITGLRLDPSKFIDTCQRLTVQVTAVDPDKQILSFSWGLLSSPPGAVATLAGMGSSATFVAQTPGTYEIGVEVKDPNGHSAGLRFPVHVGGQPKDVCVLQPVPPVLTGTVAMPTLPLETEPKPIRTRNVTVDPAGIIPPSNQTVELELFPGTKLTLVGERIEPAGRGFVWVGHVAGEPGSLAVLSVQPGVLVGNITTEKGELFQIRPAGNGVHRVLQVDPNSFSPEGNTPTIHPPPAEEDPCGGTDPGVDIDVMVVYTPNARNSNGGTEGIEALVYLAVAETNQSYINSSVTQRMRLVHLEEVSYTESANSTTDKERLKNPADGYVDNVHTLRDTYGADVVVMVTDYLQSSICGEAYIMGTVSTAFESSAFAVVKDSCATGYYSFGHEVGHIMSARHDRYVDNTDGSPYDYNHGLTNASGGWRTVMGYNTACADVGASCTRVPYWSNPSVSYSGSPTGIASGSTAADNARTLNNTDVTVANFRCSAPNVDDVWMRDSWDDTGLEPDPATAGQAMWQSPYIWARNSQDAGLVYQHIHENPVFGSPSWIYTKIHNGGNTTASGTLEIYYANASTSLTWPAGWTLIGSVAVSGFAAHTTKVVELAWPSLPGAGHFCLLARWVSAADPMTFAEGSDINVNVRNNNNLAWRNLNILSPGADGSMDASFEVRSTERDAPLSIFIGPPREEVNGSFLQYGQGEIKLDEALLGAWRQGGSQGSGFEAQADGTLRITRAAGAVLSNIVLAPTAVGRGHLRLRALPTTPRRLYHLDAIQILPSKDLTQAVAPMFGRIVGGVSYEIQL